MGVGRATVYGCRIVGKEYVCADVCPIRCMGADHQFLRPRGNDYCTVMRARFVCLRDRLFVVGVPDVSFLCSTADCR